jgi:hypothetical protein
MSPHFFPSRRKLLQRLGLLTGALALPPVLRSLGAQFSASSTLTPIAPSTLPSPTPIAAAGLSPHRVALIKTTDRAAGVRQAIELLQPPSFRDKQVFKPRPSWNLEFLATWNL